jgi:bifunctional DNase/RNase
MFVYKVALDVSRGVGVVLLADESLRRLLPISIRIVEAQAIATELQGETHKRPFTHDLLNNIIHELGFTVERVDITALHEDVYYALITITRDGAREAQIDARPSDSIALALRANAKIYVAESVLGELEMRADMLETEGGVGETDEEEMEAFRRLISQIPSPDEGNEGRESSGDADNADQ